jgi:dTDP-4-amino-4,6-dideoxygalactose transaminase
MPLVVDDRPAWAEALRARGVASISWWAGYHRALPWDDFPDACKLKDRVLALHVHQDLDDAAMDYVAGHLAGVAEARAPRSAR